MARVAERRCPTCRSLVNVTMSSGRIEQHRAFFGRVARGIQIAEHCSASGKSYYLLIAAEEFVCAP